MKVDALINSQYRVELSQSGKSMSNIKGVETFPAFIMQN